MLRQTVANQLKVRIEEGKWHKAFNHLGVLGRMDIKAVQLVVTELCQAVEDLETRVLDLESVNDTYSLSQSPSEEIEKAVAEAEETTTAVQNDTSQPKPKKTTKKK